MQKTRALILVFFLQMFAGMLFGQERYGLEIGPYAGKGFWKSRNFQVGPPQASPPINLGFAYEDKPIYGVRFNLLSNGYWGGELDYSYQQNTVTLTRPGFTSVPLEGGIHHFFYNEVFYPTRYSHTVTPFIMAGLGVAGYHLSDKTMARALDPRGFGMGVLKSVDKRFIFNYGGGVKVPVSSNFGIRADIRHNFSDPPRYGLPKRSSNPAQVVLPIGGKLQSFDVSAGFYFYVLR